MRDVAERIHFKSMGMDVDTLNTVSMGRGDKEVVVFVDPRCAVCHQLMGDAKSLVDDYTFKFIVIPALGAESNRTAKNLYCAKDKTHALDALMNNTGFPSFKRNLRPRPIRPNAADSSFHWD